MSTSKSQPAPIDIMEGVQPAEDNTPFSSPHWVASQGIRFYRGRPRKIKGWRSQAFDNSALVSGYCRSVFSAMLSDRVYTLLGTNTKLYSLIGTQLTNITPLQTTTIAIANSLATHYATLANNPITTVLGSMNIAVADTEAAKFVAGDTYKLAGSAAVNGIPAASINQALVVRSVGVNIINLTVDTAATSAGTGGGAAVVRSSGLITVSAAAHGQANGDRTKILAAVAAGGITAPQINAEWIIRNVAAGAFDIMTAGAATSSVSAAGGAATTYQKEIVAGLANESAGQGYGMGKYGVGLYGVSKLATSARTLPRTWASDRFGNVIIMTPGNQTGLYTWAQSIQVAPTLVTNAPTQINYVFVSDDTVITFGAAGVENRVQTSDQGALTTWAGTPENQVYENDIQGSGRLISHANVKGVNLIWTNNQTRTMRKIDKSAGVWEIKDLDLKIGIIAQNARIVVAGAAYWMGEDNFYMWAGGDIAIIPSNSGGPNNTLGGASTILSHVFDDINLAQKSKFFVEYIEKFTEVRFHYCSANSNECDRVACVNIASFAWWPDVSDRSACEYPDKLLSNHRMISSSGVLYQHETGNDDDTDALPFSLSSPRRYSGKTTALITALIPDSISTGDIALELQTFLYPQSPDPISDKSTTITPETKIAPFAEDGRYWEWTLSGDDLDQTFIMGDWQDELQASSKQ